MSEVDRAGRSALHYAALDDDTCQVASLIQAGAEPDLQDTQGFAPLHFAAQEYSLNAARALLEAGAAVDVADVHGNTPLFTATFNSMGRGDMIELLRSFGADADAVNKHGQTPRRLAELIGNYDIASFYRD